MGSVHSERYQRIRGAKAVGVFSRNRERAEAAAKIWGATAVAAKRLKIVAQGFSPGLRPPRIRPERATEDVACCYQIFWP